MIKCEIQPAAGETIDRDGCAVTVRLGRRLPVLALVLVMLAAGGCRLLEERQAEPPLSPEPPPAPAEPVPEPVPQADLSTAMEYLETGKGDAARAVLAELAQEAPDSGVLASLLRQIDEPAERLLPGPYREVEVGAGESLSLIAARELGDPLMFYALARLNGIDVPSQVPVGAVLRVPATSARGASLGDDGDDRRDQPSSDASGAPSEVTIPEIESVAEYLARSGQNDQARAMLIGRLGESEVVGAESTRQLLARLTLEDANQLRAEGELARAVNVIEDTLEVMGASAQRDALVKAREELRSDILREEALRLRNRGELVAAYRVAQNAASLESDSDEAGALVGDLRTELVDSLHNEALVAWRDRNVDLAIRTWESLLEAVPDFEPARVYLERARRLRERLDEPRDSGQVR